MGPYFSAAPTTIDRKRLPPGLVAVLDNPRILYAVIGELHAYADTNRSHDRPRRGIVFRLVEEWEQRAITQKLWNYFGPKAAAEEEHKFKVTIGHMHVIDDSGMSHAISRHGSGEAENPDLKLTALDFNKIPEVVNPRYIVEFSVIKGMPRIVYRKHFDQNSIIVVQEIQQKAGLLIKTIYKQK